MRMKPVDKINKHINLIDRVAEAKKTLDDLKINWETDVEKMAFDKLQSGNMVKGCEYLRMDKIKIEPNPDKEYLFNTDEHEAERMVNLIELMNGNNKVIPPMYIFNYDIIDGVKVAKRSNGPIENSDYQVDGAHRKKIAAFLQLPEIPIVVFERLDTYMFTPKKWKFEEKPITERTLHGYQATGSSIEAISNKGKVVTIKLLGGARSIAVEENNLEYIKFCIY